MVDSQQYLKEREHEFEQSRNELENILRESLMQVFKPQTKRSIIQQSLEDSQKENMNFLLRSNKQDNKESVNIDFSYVSQYEEDLNQIVKDPLKRY